MNKNMIEITATVITETELAILIDDGGGEVWLPKSQIEDYPGINEIGTIELPEWLAHEKGLI